EAIAAERGVTLPLCLDIDMSSDYPGLHFGVRRSPIVDVAGALAVARAVKACPHLRLEAALGYEAQIPGLPPAAPSSPAKSAVVRFLKGRSMPEIVKRRTSIVAALRGEGFALRFVNGGGTGSLEPTAQDPSVTEVAAGSGLYAPTLFDGYRAFR